MRSWFIAGFPTTSQYESIGTDKLHEFGQATSFDRLLVYGVHKQVLLPNFADVNIAMEHQSANSRTINEDMLTLSNEMQNTMESMYESFLAVSQLNEAAKELQQEISYFKVK